MDAQPGSRPEDDLLGVTTEVTLSNCDREPIHIPGAIQPHGFLLTVDPGDLRICQASSNVGALLGIPVDELIGQPVARLVGEESLPALRKRAAPESDQIAATAVEVEGVSKAMACELSVHRSGGLMVCEFEPRGGAEAPTGIVEPRRPLSVTGGVQELFDRAASEVRQLTGYDRVMVYRFDDDGHGEVIGEARHEGLEPLLGHHYPATDIPRQARALYLRQIIRMIVDVDYEPAAVVPAENPLTGDPLDLGLATLRSVSPIHLQYLRNMGVRATLTISLISDGELWGMIACHHYAGAHFVPYRLRAACQFIGELLSAQLANAQSVEYESEYGTLTAAHGEILATIRRAQDVITGLRAVAEPLADLWSADGVALLTHDGRITWGYVPGPETEAEILAQAPPRQPLVIDRLSRELPSISRQTELSGVLALPLPDRLGTRIVWYRDDWARELVWGGDPTVAVRPDLTSVDIKSLSPRRSFETWRQAVVGQSRPWSRAQRQAATELVERLAELR